MNEEIIKNRLQQKKWHEERMKNNRCDLFKENINEKLDIPYANDNSSRHFLDVIFPNDNKEHPVILEIHGGGFIACNKVINRLHNRWFAQHKYYVVNGEYTLFPEGNFTDELNELAEMLNWINDNADIYHFDQNKVFLMGDSAGGYLVLLYALIQENVALQEKFNVNISKLKAKVVITSCPAVRISQNPNDSMETLFRLMFPKGLDKLEEKDLDLIYLLSRYKRTVPILIVTTPTDDLVYKDAVELKRALEKENMRYWYQEYNGRNRKLDHVFNVLFPEYEESNLANTDIITVLESYDG